MIGIRCFALAALAGVGISLSGCGNDAAAPAPPTVSEDDVGDRTLATAIGDAPGLTTLSAALSDAGLAGVFDGPGSYTVLAPDDDAFARGGNGSPALTDPSRRAELVAVLRGHILPGHLTPEAIRKAIAAKKGPVAMTTLADGTVTFAAEGDKLTVTGPDGSKATIDGAALIASNGVALPLDGLVKRTEPGG